DQHVVAALDGAALEKQRDVEDDERHAARARLRDKPPLGLAHHRMEDPLEPAQRRLVAEDKLPKTLAVDPAFLGAHPGEHRLDRPDGRTAWPEQPMDRRIGVEERHPEPPQRPRSGPYPHPDRA